MTFFIDRWRGLLLATVGLLAVVTVAGCAGNTNTNGKRVATLATGAASASPAANARPSDEGRPRLRMDMTREEKDRLYDAHRQCLYDHGVPKDAKQRTRMARALYQKAYDACKSSVPLPVWEYDKNNPEARDNVHKVVECLRKQGVKYVDETEPEPGNDAVGVSLGGKNNDSESIRKGMALIPVCEKQIFGGVSK
jgi:hypothetical protein